MLNSAEILKITQPERLFTGSEENIKKQFRELARHFHPDVHKGDSGPFNKINELYQRVLKRIKDGTWGIDGAYRVELRDGRFHNIHSVTNRPFELGHLYIGHDHVTYLVDEQFKDLFYNATKAKSFRFASDRMRDQVQPYLPSDLQVLKFKNGQRGLKIKKDPEMLNLRDVLIHYNGRVPGKHTAWILGTMCNLACYLNYTRISHQDFSLDSYFIHPRLHTGALLGGWWYAKPFDSDVKNVPVRTLNALPFRVKMTKKASPLTDSELIRCCGRELLGVDMKVPAPIKNWISSAATKDAIHDYGLWQTARDASGKREFIKMNLTEDGLYG
jgi:hypothetical protein